jgi:hypothetical protein
MIVPARFFGYTPLELPLEWRSHPPNILEQLFLLVGQVRHGY